MDPKNTIKKNIQRRSEVVDVVPKNVKENNRRDTRSTFEN